MVPDQSGQHDTAAARPLDLAGEATSAAAAAVAYATAGWWVLPVRPRAKVPMTVRGLYDSTTNALVVERWWWRWPGANVGLRTGPESGLLVVDTDGARGAATWAALDATWSVPDTAEVQTGRGRHRYFAYPPGASLGNTAGRLGRGVDTRGRGGYVLAPPSVHPSGARYRWAGATSEIAAAPLWLVLALSPRQDPGPRPGRWDASATAGGGYVAAALRGEAAAVAQTPPGERNARLNLAAFRMGTLYARGADFGTVAAALLDAAVAAGLGEHEARRTIVSGWSAGQTRPRQRA